MNTLPQNHLLLLFLLLGMSISFFGCKTGKPDDVKDDPPYGKVKPVAASIRINSDNSPIDTVLNETTPINLTVTANSEVPHGAKIKVGRGSYSDCFELTACDGGYVGDYPGSLAGVTKVKIKLYTTYNDSDGSCSGGGEEKEKTLQDPYICS